MDEILGAYLRSETGAEEEDGLVRLIEERAGPIMRRVVTKKLSGLWDDIDDVLGEARLELLLRLRRLRTPQPGGEIEDFEAYTATLAANACNRYFRRRHPGRARLGQQIRFLLREDASFAVTAAGDGPARCGLAKWGGLGNKTAAVPAEVEGERDLAVLIGGILERAGGPVEITALVDAIAKTWRIADDAAPPEDAPAGAEAALDTRRFTASLWAEVKTLPRAQRVALLLSLRDGRGNSVLSMFPLFGLATFAEIAGVLEVGEADLEKMWTGLPWADAEIAALLGLTRQQVINLRMSARKRLANRLGGMRVI